MNEDELTEEDLKHIQRLQILRESGTHNMFMECKDGLEEHFGEEGEETYEWVVDNFEYFRSGEWVDVDVQGAKA